MPLGKFSQLASGRLWRALDGYLALCSERLTTDLSVGICMCSIICYFSKSLAVRLAGARLIATLMGGGGYTNKQAAAFGEGVWHKISYGGRLSASLSGFIRREFKVTGFFLGLRF